MSKYTTQVRFICENALNLTSQGDYSNINDAISAGRNSIFTFDYNIFDDNYKAVIETEFLRHFYTREIGFETVALWKLKLEDVWKLKIPYYNKMWESANLTFNPLYDVDYTTDHSGNAQTDTSENRYNESFTNNSERGKTTNENETNTESETHSLNKYSDTPQGALNGVIDTDWLTNATQDDEETDGTATSKTLTDRENDKLTTSKGMNDTSSNIYNIDSYIDRVYGKRGGMSYSKMILEWRDTFVNIDEKFINEFNDLFMLVY